MLQEIKRNLGSMLWGVLILVLLPSNGFAQLPGQQVPDSVSLTDIRFFADEEAGSFFLKALKIAEDDFAARDQALEMALVAAQNAHDQAAEALIATELGQSCMRQGMPIEGFDWVNRSLSIDSTLSPLSPIRQRIHLNIAGIYSHFDAHRLALEQFRLALQIDENRSPEASGRRYRHCTNIAICFQQLGEMDSAFAYYHRAIAITKRIGDHYWEASGLNNLGMAYQRTGNFDAALQHFEQAIAILPAVNGGDHNFVLSIHDNLGYVDLDLGRFENALVEFQGNLARVYLPDDIESKVKARLGMGNALVALQQPQAADHEIQEIVQMLQGASARIKVDYALPLRRLRIALAKACGDWRTVAEEQDKVMHAQDSLAQQTMVWKVGTLENLILDKNATFKAAMELSQSRTAALQSRSRFQNLLYASALVMVMLILAVVLVAMRRRGEREKAGQLQERYRRELAELGLKNQQLENVQLQYQLEMKKRDITDFALVHSQRRKVFEEMLESLRRIKRTSNQEQALQELIHNLKGKMDAEGAMSLESQHVDLVNNAFFDKLRSGFPQLSPAEQELCSMIRLGYTVKDIASLRNIAPASVRIGKTRLKKKLNLGPDQSLTDFLMTF